MTAQLSERAIAVPFRIAGTGGVAVLTTPEQIWDQRVRAALLTRQNERFARMGYGSTLADLVYSGSSASQDEIEQEVARSFSGLLPSLTLVSVEVLWDEFTNQTNVAISYQLPNQDVITTTVGVVSIDGNLPPIEENL